MLPQKIKGTDRVPDRNTRELEIVWLSGFRISGRWTGRATGRAKDVGADYEILFGVNQFARTDQRWPPCPLWIRISGEGMAKPDNFSVTSIFKRRSVVSNFQIVNTSASFEVKCTNVLINVLYHSSKINVLAPTSQNHHKTDSFIERKIKKISVVNVENAYFCLLGLKVKERQLLLQNKGP